MPASFFHPPSHATGVFVAPAKRQLYAPGEAPKPPPRQFTLGAKKQQEDGGSRAKSNPQRLPGLRKSKSR